MPTLREKTLLGFGLRDSLWLQLFTIKFKEVRCILFGSLLLWTACSSTVHNNGDRPNILLIVSEDNGPDLGCYSVGAVHTPHLDQLAAEGMLFSKAFVTYSVCSPSRSTLFTGLYPHQNGQIGLATHKYRMYEPYPSMPLFLKKGGYRTGCLGKIHVNPESAIPWDFHEIKSSNFAKKGLQRYAEYAEQFISDGEDPFFLMVNYPDAHCDWQRQVEGMPANPMDGDDLGGSMPFVGVDNERLRDLTADYYNSINRLDEAVGMLLESLENTGEAENTLVIYLSDHGAQFSRGKCSNYDSGLQVPFIVRWPGMIAGKSVSDHLISTIDLLPTVLSAAGLAVPDDLPGKSLLPILRADSRSIEHHAYIFADGAGSAAFYTYPRRSVRDKRFKLIKNLIHERDNPKYLAYAFQMYGTGTLPEELQSASLVVKRAYETWRNPPEYELYDLKSDPYEFNDLSQDLEYSREQERLRTVLESWQVETADPLHDPIILDRFISEMDSINQLYPNRDYNRKKDFGWNYPNYFKTYIDGRAGG